MISKVISQRTSQPGFACLTYHIVGEGQGQYAVSEGQLREHLAFLKRYGYTVEGFDGLESRVRAGKDLPERYAVVTLDDGDYSAMVSADILSEFGFGATFFLTRDRSVGRSGYIRRSEIRELRSRGFSLGTHGTTHRKLTFLPERACLAELAESKEWLEGVLGEAVGYWAAPGGYVNRRVVACAKECGYVLGGTCREWMNTGKPALPATINRVNIRRNFSVDRIRRIACGDPAFYLWRQARSAALYVPKQLFRG